MPLRKENTVLFTENLALDRKSSFQYAKFKEGLNRSIQI